MDETAYIKRQLADESAGAIEGFGVPRPTTGVSHVPSPVSRATAAARQPERSRPELRLETALRLDFNHVYATHFHDVARWVRAFGGLNADVEDLAQEVFLVVQRRIESFRGDNLPGWLYGIARKVVSDHRRRAWFRRWLHGVDPESVESRRDRLDAGGTLERREAQRVVAAVLNDLSPLRRSTFILFEIEGYSGEEIALLEDVPVNTVYTRLHHARKDFYRLMAARLHEGAER